MRGSKNDTACDTNAATAETLETTTVRWRNMRECEEAMMVDGGYSSEAWVKKGTWCSQWHE